MKVDSLAYLGLGVADEERWAEFAVQGLGLQEATRGSGTRRLRMDERAWRLALHRSASNDILYVGFDVAGAAAVRALAGALDRSGIEQRMLTAAEIAERAVGGGIVAHDPQGLRLEFVHGCADAGPFAPTRGSGFVTGAGGLGHIVLAAADPTTSARFYELIGFRVSDYIDLAIGPQTLRIAFYHCNKRHHTLALAPLPSPRRLDHLMIEVATPDEVIDTYNRLLLRGHPMKRHLGRHSNDRMLSFYVTTPAGFDLEFGCQGVEIGDRWQVRTYDAISLWGHQTMPTARTSVQSDGQ
jgi:biphenyl-2,3-diol 1,2-dioxygenase